MMRLLVLSFLFLINNYCLFAQVVFNEYTNTILTPILNEPIRSGKNIVFGASLKIAWDKAISDFVKQPIKLSGQPTLADELNAPFFSEADIDSESFFSVFAPLTAESLANTAKDVRERFNIIPDLGFAPKADPLSEEFYIYSAICKILCFEPEFEPAKFPFRAFDSDLVSFGIPSGAENRFVEMRKRVKVLDYYDPTPDLFALKIGQQIRDREFVVSLQSKNSEDVILLAKVTPKETLEKTISDVHNRIQNSTSSSVISDSERLTIPNIIVSISKNYSTLCNKHVINDSVINTQAFFGLAQQNVMFSMNKSGVKLFDESKIRVILGAIEMERPREFVFDKPFLVCLLKRDRKTPYFALWVENHEILEKW